MSKLAHIQQGPQAQRVSLPLCFYWLLVFFISEAWVLGETAPTLEAALTASPVSTEAPMHTQSVVLPITQQLAQTWSISEETLWFFISAALLLITCIGLLISISSKRFATTTSCLAVATLAVVLTSQQLVRMQHLQYTLEQTVISQLELEVYGEGRERFGTWSYQARIPAYSDFGACWVEVSIKRPLNVWEASSSTDAQLSSQGRYRFVGRYSKPKANAFDRARMQQGYVGCIQVQAILQKSSKADLPLWEQLRSYVYRVLKPAQSSGRAFMFAALTGSKIGLQQQNLLKDCRAAGASHIIAISGAHLMMLGNWVNALTMHAHASKRMRLLLCLLVTGFFVLVCAHPASAVRAWLMSVGASVSFCMGRRHSSLAAVCWVGLILGVFDPYIASNLGFLLSLSSVVALCVFGLRMQSFVKRKNNKLWAWVGNTKNKDWIYATRKKFALLIVHAEDLLSIALVCQLASLPLIVTHFETTSLIGCISSLILVPLFSLLMALACCILCITGVTSLVFGVLTPRIPEIATQLWWIGEKLGDVFSAVITFFAHTPLSSIELHVDPRYVWIGILFVAVFCYVKTSSPHRQTAFTLMLEDLRTRL